MNLDTLKSRLHLLTADNPKIAKGLKRGVLTAVLHLLPANEYARLAVLNGDPLGENLCPWAGACKASCLNTAGRGGIPMARYGGTAFANNVQHGRYKRTRLLHTDPAKFCRLLEKDVRTLAEWARAHDLDAACRLNGTSDVHWEARFPGLADLFADLGVARYDYTKDPLRARRGTVDGVKYTYSLDAGADRERLARAILARGGNVAVVVARDAQLPAIWWGHPTVDGDETDLRHLDPPGHVVLLRAKGKARQDRTGFVRSAATGLPVI